MKKAEYNLYLFALLALLWNGCTGKEEYQAPDWTMMEKILAEIQEPVFPDYTIDIKQKGAAEGGTFDCSEAIEAAISDAHKNGGGTVLIPSGIWLTGPITLKSNIRLHLEEKAELRFSTTPGDYLPPVLTRWEGIDCYNYHPLIYAKDAENIAITGKGVLNGMADNTHWWPWKGKTEFGFIEGSASQLDPDSRPRLKEYNIAQTPVEERVFGEGSTLRPQFINFYNCRNILLEDISVVQSPFWLIHPVLSENIILRRVTMESNGPNNDGCDPESSKNILFENCYFNTGDDCIAIKSGRNEDGRRWNRPSENIIVRNCTMNNGHGGVVIGSEISGGCRNVFVENCVMDSPELDRAIRIKTNTLRGGTVENLFVRNVEIGEVDEAVLRINCHYDMKNVEQGAFIPSIRNIHLINVTNKKSEHALFLEGVEDQDCINDIFVVDCVFEGVAEENILMHVNNLVSLNTTVNGSLIAR